MGFDQYHELADTEQVRRFWVTLTHRRSGRTAKIDATPTKSLDVFNHPFANTRAVAR